MRQECYEYFRCFSHSSILFGEDGENTVKKFACLSLVNSRDEIPVKHSVSRLSQTWEFDKYIQKFNPFVISELKFQGAQGYYVKLPLTASDMSGESYVSVIEKTLSALKEYNVDIVLPSKDIPANLLSGINIADGNRLAPFFMNQVFSLFGKRKHDVVIVDGEESYSLIDNLHKWVNSLTILTDNNKIDGYNEKTAKAAAESGLVISVCSSSNVLKNSSFVINKSDCLRNYIFAIQKNAVVFDLAGNKRLGELAAARPDLHMFSSRDIMLEVEGRRTPLAQYEVSLYLQLDAYREIQRGNFLPGYADEVCRTLASEAKVVALKPYDGG